MPQEVPSQRGVPRFGSKSSCQAPDDLRGVRAHRHVRCAHAVADEAAKEQRRRGIVEERVECLPTKRGGEHPLRVLAARSVQAGEVRRMDGSSSPFLQALLEDGLERQADTFEYLQVRQPVQVTAEGGTMAMLMPPSSSGHKAKAIDSLLRTSAQTVCSDAAQMAGFG